MANSIAVKIIKPQRTLRGTKECEYLSNLGVGFLYLWSAMDYFFLSTRNLASSFSVSARWPKLSSCEKAPVTSSSAFC